MHSINYQSSNWKKAEYYKKESFAPLVNLGGYSLFGTIYSLFSFMSNQCQFYKAEIILILLSLLLCSNSKNCLWKLVKQSFEKVVGGGNLPVGAFYLFMSPWQMAFKVQVLGPHRLAVTPLLAVPIQCMLGVGESQVKRLHCVATCCSLRSQHGWIHATPHSNCVLYSFDQVVRVRWIPEAYLSGSTQTWWRANWWFCMAFTNLLLQISIPLEMFMKKNALQLKGIGITISSYF